MGRWAVAVVLLLCASLARGEDRPLPARIREANLKATKAIAARWSGLKPGDTTYEGHAKTLVALTLLRAGGPQERATAQKLLDEWWLDAVAGRFGDPTQPATYGTYVVALGISALEAQTLEPIEDDTTTLTRYTKKPVGEDLKKRLEIATKALLDSGDESGSWGYRVRPFKDKDLGHRNGSDLSNTQFAVLALHDAARGGVAIPREKLDAIVGYVAAEAHEDMRAAAGKGGARRLRWNYRLESGARSVSAMTFAALSVLAIARSLDAKDERLEPTIAGGLTDLNKLVRMAGPATDGEHGFGNAYVLYSLEKALDLLELEQLDGKDWFAPIAERVLKTQGTGGLYGGGDLIDSCLYVLFLQRATFGSSRLGRTITKAAPEADVLAALKSFGDAPGSATRASADAAIAKLLATGGAREALALPAIVDLSKRPGTRDIAGKWLKDLCGKAPSTEELTTSLDRLEKVRAPTPKPEDLKAAFDKTTLLPVRAFAAQKATAELLIDAADVLDDESVLETRAGARCAHAFEEALKKLIAQLPALGDEVRPAELRHFVKVARERK